MSGELGPWGRRDGGGKAPTDWRFLIWLGLILAGAIGVWQLWRLFPNALAEPQDQAYFVQLCVMLMLVASAIAFRRRFTARAALRNAAIWLGIIVVLGAGYMFYRQIGSELV